MVSAHGKGAIDEHHPLHVGAFGIATRPDAMRFLEAHPPDACLFLGTSLNECSTGAWSPRLAGIPSKIHIDRDAARLGRGFPVEHAIAADIGDVLAVLAEAVPRTTAFAASTTKTSRAEGDDLHAVDGEVHPRSLLRALGRSLPRSCRVVSDIGNCMLWAIQELELTRDQAFFVPMSLGSMGSGIGAAVGLVASSPATPTLCLAGDCAMLMLGAELHTAVAAEHPLKVVVLNDGGHGTVDAGLGMLGLRGASVRFPKRVDFAAWARALGFEARVVHTQGDLARFDWASFWSSGTPTFLDVHIDPSVPPPLDLRIKGLGAPGLASAVDG
jgi:acetolactate synthase I/II/III large subunit